MCFEKTKVFQRLEHRLSIFTTRNKNLCGEYKTHHWETFYDEYEWNNFMRVLKGGRQSVVGTYSVFRYKPHSSIKPHPYIKPHPFEKWHPSVKLHPISTKQFLGYFFS